MIQSCSKFCLSICILMLQITSKSSKSWFGAVGSWLSFGILILILKVQRTFMSFKSWFRLWRMLNIPDLGYASWSWFRYGQWSLIHQWSDFWLSVLILKVQRTSMSFKSWFGPLEDAGGSWLGFGIFILIWIWSLVFDTPMFQILAQYLDFEGAENIQVI